MVLQARQEVATTRVLRMLNAACLQEYLNVKEAVLVSYFIKFI